MHHALFASLVFLTAIQAAAQTSTAARNVPPTASAGRWTPTRTADGQPDLQGIWLNNSATPLERPKALEGRPFLTDAEVAELKNRAARLFHGTNRSDFAGGDNVFLAALADLEEYKSPARTTGGNDEMIERQFDNRTSLVVDPPDGRIPPLTPEGRERLAKSPPPAGSAQRLPAGPEDLSAGLRCITYGTPRLGVANLNSAGPLGYYQIVQAPGYVVLMLEAIHEARIISLDGPLDGRPRLPDHIGRWNGDSRGRWQGNTLTVETTNFSPQGNFMGSAGNLHLLERFTRIASDEITYEITVNDPTTWTRPWTAVIRLRQSQERMYEYACHEGNYYTMLGMLGAARAAEKAEAARAGAKVK